jgi:hypothetical protein
MMVNRLTKTSFYAFLDSQLIRQGHQSFDDWKTEIIHEIMSSKQGEWEPTL